MIDKSHCKIKFYGQEDEFAPFYKWGMEEEEEEEEGEEEGEEGEEGEEEEGRELLAVESENDKQLSVRPVVSLSETGAELVLQDGKQIGHRSYARYYKQKYKPEDLRESVLINKLCSQYRELNIVTHGTRRERDRKNPYFAKNAIHHRNKVALNLQLKSNKLPTYMRHDTHMT